MSKSIRLLVAVLITLLTMGVGVGAADASQDVNFSVHKGPPTDGDSWHGEVAGHVRFFGTNRRFRVVGVGHFHHSPTDDGFGYLQARQNVAHQANDPAGRQVQEGTCTSDTVVPAITYHCDINRLIESPTQPGHGLAGVWLRVCVDHGAGPDACGPRQYRDNPLQG